MLDKKSKPKAIKQALLQSKMNKEKNAYVLSIKLLIKQMWNSNCDHRKILEKY